ncbi:MAG: hypothetical protein ABSG15_04305 [FCB group bacterium]
MKRINYLICCLLLIFSHEQILAQCCTAGNPSSTNCSISEGGKEILMMTYSHMYSISDTYYNGIQKLDKTYIDSYFNFSSLSLSYGISNKMRLTTDIGYFFNKAQKFVNLDYLRYTHGIADLNIGLIYSTYKSDDKLFEVMQTAKLTIPVGHFNQQYDDIVMPIDEQPSSGNYKYNLGLNLSKKFENSSLSLLSVNSFEMSQTIKTETLNHKYGNLYNLSLIGIYRISSEFSGMLQLRSEIREKALTSDTSRNNYSYINASGGVIAFISPMLSYNLNNYWFFSFQYNQPFYKNVNSEQLTNKYSVSLSISKSFDFSSQQESLLPSGNDTSLLKKTISVNGNCDMCKKRIETVANEFKNITNSEWDKGTKLLTIFYKEDMPDLDRLEKSLADAGHDNEKYKATDDVYSKLPKCCLYRK